MVAVAIGGAALVGAAGSAVASSNNSKAISKSTDSSLQANRESLAAQQAMFDKQLAAQQGALSQSLEYQTNALNQTNSYNQQAYNNSGQLQTDVRNQNVGILNPFAQTGYAAMNQINGLIGLPQQAAYHAQDIQFNPISVAPIAAPVAAPVAATLPATVPPGPTAATGALAPALSAGNIMNDPAHIAAISAGYRR